MTHARSPAALGELLTEVDALVSAWAGALTTGVSDTGSSDPAADVLVMSDIGLVSVTHALAGLSKRVDALTVRCAAGRSPGARRAKPETTGLRGGSATQRRPG